MKVIGRIRDNGYNFANNQINFHNHRITFHVGDFVKCKKRIGRRAIGARD